jgi:hypothetical protein
VEGEGGGDGEGDAEDGYGLGWFLWGSFAVAGYG